MESKNWKDDHGFWIHDGTNWLKDIYFKHIFDVLRIKKKFLGGQEKIQWHIYLQANGNDRIECELDGTYYSRREVIGGKAGDQIKTAHKSTHKDFYRLEIKVTEDGVEQKVGQAKDTVPRKIQGRTGFINKFGLRLVE